MSSTPRPRPGHIVDAARRAREARWVAEAQAKGSASPEPAAADVLDPADSAGPPPAGA